MADPQPADTPGSAPPPEVAPPAVPAGDEVVADAAADADAAAPADAPADVAGTPAGDAVPMSMLAELTAPDAGGDADASAAPAPAGLVDEDDDDAALLGVAPSAATKVPDAEAAASDAAPPAADDEVSAAAAPADADDDAAAAVAEEEEAAEEQPVPEPEDSVPEGTTLADLFGGFHPDTMQAQPDDPVLYDVQNVIRDCFGDFITEHEVYDDFHIDVDIDDHRLHVVTHHKRLDDAQPVKDIFGEEALDWFTHDYIEGGTLEHASIVQCTKPENPFTKAVRHGVDEAWLLDMAKVHPNRQVLHFVKQPFDRMGATKPQNTNRDFFIPQNCVQWAKTKSGKTVSNARLVRWSDGSATLHVGSDVYELPDNNERVLSMIARRADITDTNGFQRDALVETLQVSRHVTAIPARGRPSSVNEALVNEIQAHRSKQGPETAVRYNTGGVPLLRSDQERRKAPEKLQKLTDEEQFMDLERATRAKDRRRAAPGTVNPIDIIQEEVEAYRQLCEAAKLHAVSDLVSRKNAELEAEKLREKRERGLVDEDGNVIAVRKNKFDRDTGFNGDADDTYSEPPAAPAAAAAAASGDDVDEGDDADELLGRTMAGARAAAGGANDAAGDAGASAGGKRSRSREAHDTLEMMRSTIEQPPADTEA